MKKTIKKFVKAANRKLQELKDLVNVNLTMPIMEILTETQWRVEQLASAAGLRVIECAIAEEVRQRTGEKYQRDGGDAYRWGSQGGYAMFAGRKVPIQKPRIQDKKTGCEVELDSYRRFQQDVRLEQDVRMEQDVMDQLALGLSTRNYEPSIRALCEGYGDHMLHRVKRWNGGDHVQRWVATALLHAEKGFRKVKGFRDMDVLIRVLSRKTSDQRKVAA